VQDKTRQRDRRTGRHAPDDSKDRAYARRAVIFIDQPEYVIA